MQFSTWVHSTPPLLHFLRGRPPPSETRAIEAAAAMALCPLVVQQKIKTLWSLATSDGNGCDCEAQLSKELFLSIMASLLLDCAD